MWLRHQFSFNKKIKKIKIKLWGLCILISKHHVYIYIYIGGERGEIEREKERRGPKRGSEEKREREERRVEGERERWREDERGEGERERDREEREEEREERERGERWGERERESLITQNSSDVLRWTEGVGACVNVMFTYVVLLLGQQYGYVTSCP